MNAQIKEFFVETYGADKTVDLLFKVLDAIPVSVFIKNDKFQTIFVNKANLELNERAEDEIIGLTDFDIHTRENAEVFQREDNMVLAEGKIRRNEEFTLRKDGTIVSFLTFKNRIELEGDVQLLVGANTVIDDLKKREKELARAIETAEAQRNELIEIVEAMPLGITIIDPNMNLVAVNKQNRINWNMDQDADFEGMAYEELVRQGHKDFPFLSAEEWERNVERCMADARQGDVAPREERGIGNSTFIYSSNLLSSGNRLTSFFNITEQKEARKQMEKAQKAALANFSDLKATMDAMPMGVLLLDKDLSIIFVNKSNYALWNLEPSDLGFGDPFQKVLEANRNNGVYDVADENWDLYVADRLAEITQGDIPPREFSRRDGVTLIFSCTALSDGKRLLTYFDITAQKNAEKIFKDAEQKAILADRAKSEFLANMSHEIRTPMNGVLGMAELLARTELDAKQRTFTDIIVKSGNALLTIINDILDFSKIDAGQLALDPAPFKLAEAIEDVATLVSARAQEKDLELIVRVDPALPENLVGDVGRIRQIVTNLMGNAVKFTESGHVVVDVSGTLEPSTASVSLMFKITDTGVGIPPDKLKLVFEKFSQIDTSSTRRHEGTGLGLAISTKLVALMGGEIGAESEVGKGSTFWFTINLPAHGMTAKKKILPLEVSNSRVLIIDDNPVNRSILLEQMRSWSFDACAATGGREGLAVLSQAKSIGLNVDAVILDYHMPEWNGADVARMVRQNPALEATPIILLTSVDTAMQGVEFDGVRIDAHLMKPARSSLLFDTIVGVISEARSRLIEKAEQISPKPVQELAPRILPEPAPVKAQPAAQPAPEKVVAATVGQPEPAPVKTVVRASEVKIGIDILVAEDNAVNQIVFTQILESLPYSFEIVDNGRKAFEAMQTKSPKMILMDVSMPEMNGLEATQAIREYEVATGKHHIPIVGVTAHALKGDRERCFDAGMDDYMTKPISPDMLAAKIEAHMGKMIEAKSA